MINDDNIGLLLRLVVFTTFPLFQAFAQIAYGLHQGMIWFITFACIYSFWAALKLDADWLRAQWPRFDAVIFRVFLHVFRVFFSGYFN